MSRDLLRTTMAAAAGLLLTAGAATHAAVVNVDYDLSSSALHNDYDDVNGLDWYTSLPIALGGATVTPADPSLTVNVSFRSATNLTQILTLDQMGLGGLQNAPSTFGSPSFLGSGVHGDHGFGPSLTLVGNASLLAGTATLTPSVFTGSLSPAYTGAASGICTSGTCDYGILFPDLIDGDTTIGLSGFSVTFALGVPGGPAALNSLAFNVIAPEISVTQIPEPQTVVLMLAGLVAIGAAKVHRRRNRDTGAVNSRGGRE
jgi:hypothetical protein